MAQEQHLPFSPQLTTSFTGEKKKKVFVIFVCCKPLQIKNSGLDTAPHFLLSESLEVWKYQKPNCYSVLERFNIQLSYKLFKSTKLILLLKFYAHYWWSLIIVVQWLIKVAMFLAD